LRSVEYGKKVELLEAQNGDAEEAATIFGPDIGGQPEKVSEI